MLHYLALLFFFGFAYLLGYFIGFLKDADKGEEYSRKEEKEGKIIWGLIFSLAGAIGNALFGILSPFISFAANILKYTFLSKLSEQLTLQIDLNYALINIAIALILYYVTSELWVIGYRLGCKHSLEFYMNTSNTQPIEEKTEEKKVEKVIVYAR